MTVAFAPRAALPLFREARSLLDRAGALPASQRREAVQGVIEGLEALAPHLREGEASRFLDHWARELLNGHSTTAAVHLDRAALALGIRPSEVRRVELPTESLLSLDRRAPVAGPAVAGPAVAEPAVAEPPVAEPAVADAPAAPEPPSVDLAGDPRFAGLSPEEQALVAKLPSADEPLQGADALARCWGERMSPTSARGRYSRLANKLKQQHGRDLLLRGRGRYARLGS